MTSTNTLDDPAIGSFIRCLGGRGSSRVRVAPATEPPEPVPDRRARARETKLYRRRLLHQNLLKRFKDVLDGMNDDEKKAMMMDKHGFIIGENGDDHLNKKMMRELYGYSRDGNGAQSKRTDVKPRSGSAVNGKDDAQRQGDGAETDQPGSRSSAWEDGHDHAEDELFCAYGGDADGGGGGGEDSTVSSEAEQKRIFRALLLKSGDELRSLIARKPGRLKRRVALGIPDVLRGQVWQLFSGGRELRIQNPSVYHKLLVYESSASETDIIHDIGRTFPTHIFFQQRHGPGQRSLFNILKAYSVYDRQVRYQISDDDDVCIGIGRQLLRMHTDTKPRVCAFVCGLARSQCCDDMAVAFERLGTFKAWASWPASCCCI